MRIALVLDASAVVSYANHGLSVGETIGEVNAEDGAFVAIPAVSLASAHLNVRGNNALVMLRRLLEDEEYPVMLAPLLGEDAATVAGMAARLKDDLALAHAVVTAEHHTAQLMTAHGRAVRAAVGDLHGIVDF